MSVMATEQELTLAQDWFVQNFALLQAHQDGPFPFACQVGERQEREIDWWVSWTEPTPGVRTLTLEEPLSGLKVTCDVTVYEDFPVVEWVMYFENTGPRDTEIISDIQPLSAIMPLTPDCECTIEHALGSDLKLDDFAPLETVLAPGGEHKLASYLGRSSNHTLPFFNLRLGVDGVVGAIGWTGGWQAIFSRAREGEVKLQAGMPRTHLKLHPGERIRSPRLMLLFWRGQKTAGGQVDHDRPHNLLRRFLLAHHTPRPGGEILQAPLCNAVWGENLAGRQIKKASWWRDHGIPLDYFWIDAGWHGDKPFQDNSTVFNSTWGQQVGNWWPNRESYPEGLGQVGQALRKMGLGFILWLEPERVYQDTYFAREHPEWLLGPSGSNYLFNLGLPEARAALTDLISNLISEGGITGYRQDFNTDPAPFWEAADAPDRVGMTEIQHIEGLYCFWDELLARHPGLIIDNCSSGGRRIDLETISRSIPLWRSDFQCWPEFDPISQQGQTQGLARWVPLSTGCCDQADTYAFRSALGPGMVITTNIYEPEPSAHFPVDWLRQMMTQETELRRYFYGDFYPLLSYNLSRDLWAAWQFDRPDLGEGVVIALRRPESPFTTMRAKLQGLAADAVYEVRDLDQGQRPSVSGAELGERGLAIEITDQPGSAVIVYKRAGN